MEAINRDRIARQQSTKDFLASKGNPVPAGALMAGDFIAPNAPSGNVISYRLGNTFYLFDKASGQPFTTVDVAPNATITSIGKAITDAAGNTAEFQQKEREKEISTAGFKANSIQAVFLRAFPMSPNKLAGYDLTVDQEGNVVAISKAYGEAMYADLGQSKDVIVVDPSTNKVVSQGQEFEEKLVWNPVASSWGKASVVAAAIEKQQNEFYDEMDRKNGVIVGTTRGMKKFVDGLVQVADGLATVATFVGVPPFVVDIYKAFAPPGSQFYQEGTTAEKFERLAKDPTFWVSIATSAVSGPLATFKAGVTAGTNAAKAVAALEGVIKAANLAAKIAEEPGSTIEDKTRNFVAGKVDLAIQGIEMVDKETSEKLTKLVDQNIRSEDQRPADVGTTTMKEPLVAPEAPGEDLAAPSDAVAVGQTVTTDPLAQTTPAVKTGGVVESIGDRNLRRFKENGNRFRKTGGAFGAQKF